MDQGTEAGPNLLYFMLLGSLCVYTVIHNAFQLCFKCT